MHIIKDENGNILSHAHEEGHCHGEGGHCKNKEDCHANGGHAHCHNHGEHAAGDKNTALLQYMLDHNTHHAAELDQMAAKLTADGQEKAAEQIKKAVDEFQKGNMYLGLALSMVKE